MASLLNQLSALGIHPKKGLGQNFLVDPAHRAHIVAAAELTADDTVLEVGPGPGVLTELIAAQAGRVIVVELVPKVASAEAEQPGLEGLNRLVRSAPKRHNTIRRVSYGYAYSRQA